MINRLKSTLLLAFCALSLVASFGAFSANSTAYAIPMCQKESTEPCPDPDTVRITCTVGVGGCDPQSC